MELISHIGNGRNVKHCECNTNKNKGNYCFWTEFEKKKRPINQIEENLAYYQQRTCALDT